MTVETLRKYANRKGIAIFGESFMRMLPINIPKETKALSVCSPDGSMAIMISDPSKWNGRTESELLAHELGHCMTGTFYNYKENTEFGTFEQECERIANEWSYRALLPENKLIRQYFLFQEMFPNEVREHEIESVFELLAEHFGVSKICVESAMKYYAHKRGLSVEELLEKIAEVLGFHWEKFFE